MTFGPPHEPDLSTVGCRGCGLPVTNSESLFKHGRYQGRACCAWHPYHKWCTRPGGRPKPRWDRCAICATELATEDVRTAAETLARAVIMKPHETPRPHATLAWRLLTSPARKLDPFGHILEREVFGRFADHGFDFEAGLRCEFEPLHRACLHVEGEPPDADGQGGQHGSTG